MDFKELWCQAIVIERLLAEIAMTGNENEITLTMLKEKIASLNSAMNSCSEKCSFNEIEKKSAYIEIEKKPVVIAESFSKVDKHENPEPAFDFTVNKQDIIDDQEDFENQVEEFETEEKNNSAEELASSTEFEEKEDSLFQEQSVTSSDSQAENKNEIPQLNQIKVEDKLFRKMTGDIRRAFSLNDKFLFRRELFGNNNRQYDEALDLISEMNSFEETRSYFLNQYGWDTDNPHVDRFLKIIANHFGE